jgi:uncharacterized iron-regulated membrane protein
VKLLSAIHRWAGGFLGLLLALLGLSGAILLWEGSWVMLPGASDPLAEDVATIARISENAAAAGDLSRITYANEEIGLHLLVYADGGGAYVRQTGEVVDRWDSIWGRPELWLFDLHHHLFAGHVGERVTGVAGLAGLMFVVTGVILWWRTRRNFAPRLLPQKFNPGAIVRHHRDLGMLAAPLLLLSMTTGTLMLFPAVSKAIIGEEVRPAAALPRPVAGRPIEAALLAAQGRFPEARLRRLTLPAEPGQPIFIRMKQAAEWTPNGRTQLAFDSRSGAPLSVEDPLAGNAAAKVSEKLYPVHSAKVGGLPMRLLMTLSGLSLALLGALATWSFWFRRAAVRASRRRFARAREAVEAA